MKSSVVNWKRLPIYGLFCVLSMNNEYSTAQTTAQEQHDVAAAHEANDPIEAARAAAEIAQLRDKLTQAKLRVLHSR
jgi:hypothetical protein